MVFFLASLMKQVLHTLGHAASDEFYWAAGVTRALAAMERIQLDGGRVLDADATARFRFEHVIFRSGFNKLAQAAIFQGRLIWHLRPKLHMWEHAVLDFLPANPRYYSNFINEDYIRRGKVLALQSHPIWMARHVLLRYCVGFCLRWKIVESPPMLINVLIVRIYMYIWPVDKLCN